MKNNLSKEIFDQYDKLLAENANLPSNQERTILCPNPDCNTTSIIWRDADYFTCPACRFKYCTNENCYGDWGKHSGLSCNEFKLKFKINDQKLFEELQKKKGWMPCPKCFSTIEKKGGSCNIIICESRKCSKKTKFCYLCGTELKDSTIKNHFPKGEFSPCVNSIKPNEEKQEEIKIENPQEPQKRENENKNFDKETDHKENINDTHNNTKDIRINMPSQQPNIKDPNQNMELSKKLRGAKMSIWLRIGYWFWNLIRWFYGLFCCRNKFDCPNCSKTHTPWCCLLFFIMFREEKNCSFCQKNSKYCYFCLVGRKRKIPCICGKTMICKHCSAPINEMDVSVLRHNDEENDIGKNLKTRIHQTI